MKFVLATNNSDKVREIREILRDSEIEAITLKEAGIFSEPEETGTTFAENAYIKAEAAMRVSGLPAVADDSGICCDALGGEPGVFSARYGGDLTPQEQCDLLLEKLRGEKNRAAKYVSCIVAVFPNGEHISASGECRGEIALQKRGDGGFGYDPIFWLPELGLTMAELPAEEKNAISQRGEALRAFKPILEDYLRRKNAKQ